MNVLVLAAGFGTRLAAIIGDRPKALIEVVGITVLEHLLARVHELPDVERIALVSNAHFVDAFEDWLRVRRVSDVAVLNDGALNAQSRLGAVGDLAFALHGGLDDGDLLVLGSDNLLGFSLAPLVAEFRRSGATTVAVRRNPDPVDRARRGNLRMAADGRVTGFVEKPPHPIGEWSAAPLYLFPHAVLARVDEYLRAGGHHDAPGHFLAWLHSREPVYGWAHEGDLLDVGNPESLAAAEARLRSDPAAFAAAEPCGSD